MAPNHLPNKCHVSTNDSSKSSATHHCCTLCHLPRHSSHVIVWSPRQMLTSSVPRVTLPVVTRVTFGLAQLCAKNSKSACHVSLPGAATCHLYGPATFHLYRPAMSAYGHATLASVRNVWTAQSANFCLFDFSDRIRYLLHTDSI
jgi:hypothetical protein